MQFEIRYIILHIYFIFCMKIWTVMSKKVIDSKTNKQQTLLQGLLLHAQENI